MDPPGARAVFRLATVLSLRTGARSAADRRRVFDTRVRPRLPILLLQGDMDEPGNALMGMHGYCTQELVNLIVTGEWHMGGACMATAG